jgi:hypothetical protein
MLLQQSEFVNLRRAENTMTKRKRTKCQTTIHTTQHRKLNILQHEPYQKPTNTEATESRVSIG